jgi:hypothetical protein
MLARNWTAEAVLREIMIYDILRNRLMNFFSMRQEKNRMTSYI